MIDVKKTILETINDKINRMRFLGENNPKKLKTLLYLIVLDDIYDWGNYIGESQVLLDKIKELRTNLILCNPDFKIQRSVIDGYFSTNTPQTSIYYSDPIEDVYQIDKKIDPIDAVDPWKEDESCEQKITFFGGPTDKYSANADGTPKINLNDLTVCEKMNIWVNRETGVAYYYDEKGIRHEIKTNTSSVAWNNVTGKPTIYTGIEHKVKTDKDVFNVSLNQEANNSSDVDIAVEKDLESII